MCKTRQDKKFTAEELRELGDQFKEWTEYIERHESLPDVKKGDMAWNEDGTH